MIVISPNKTKNENKYICPTEGCNLIPEIISTHTELGLIVLKCNKGHENKIDVEDYLNFLKNNKRINPQGDNIENQDETKVLHSHEVISNKINLISKIIQTHQQILETQENYPENYYHNQNIINVAGFIEKENTAIIDFEENNQMKTMMIDDVIQEIEEKRKKENEIIKTLEKNYYIKLDKKKYFDEELNLELQMSDNSTKYLKLEDEGFKLLSKIIFKRLISLNLSNNAIRDITPLNDMLLPHLEMIDLSKNKIVDITPVAELASEYLSEIYLQNNQIGDLNPFLDSDFPYLETLRVDGNEIAIKKDSFKEVSLKFGKIMMSKPKKWDDLAKKYNFYIDGKTEQIKPEDYLNSKKIDLSSKKEKNILIDLCPLIIYPNKIEYLYLDDNKIEDASLLKRTPLYNLVHLDLSLNFITNIKFLNIMCFKCKELKRLFLNDNKINDISLFSKLDKETKNGFMGNLDSLTLKHNCLNINDNNTKDILDKLIHTKDLAFDYKSKDLKADEDDNNSDNNTSENNDNENDNIDSDQN